MMRNTLQALKAGLYALLIIGGIACAPASLGWIGWREAIGVTVSLSAASIGVSLLISWVEEVPKEDS